MLWGDSVGRYPLSLSVQPCCFACVWVLLLSFSVPALIRDIFLWLYFFYFMLDKLCCVVVESSY